MKRQSQKSGKLILLVNMLIASLAYGGDTPSVEGRHLVISLN